MVSFVAAFFFIAPGAGPLLCHLEGIHGTSFISVSSQHMARGQPKSGANASQIRLGYAILKKSHPNLDTGLFLAHTEGTANVAGLQGKYI